MRLGMLALISPVITSTEGRCVARMRWMPAARAFCASRAISSSTFLPVSIIMSASSSTTTTIQGSFASTGASPSEPSGRNSGSLIGAPPSGRRAHLAVVAADVAHPQRRHQPVAPVHLHDAPAQRVRRMLHVRHHRREEVRNALVHRQLQHLRIDHDHPHVGAGRLVEQAQDHRVDGDRLAGAGGARHEEVGACSPDPPPPAVPRCPCQAQREMGGVGVVLAGLEHIAQDHDSPVPRWESPARWCSCPGMTSTMRTLTVESDRARSLARLVTRLTLSPGAGCSS